MKEDIDRRFDELVTKGTQLVGTIPLDEDSSQYWVPDNQLVEFQQWLGSSANLINYIAESDSTFIVECRRIMSDPDTRHGLPSRMVQMMLGLLTAARDEWERGLLKKLEYIVIAEAFDDFLDHASYYHKGNKKTESSILASAVLEDTVKKIAKKNNIETKGISLEPLIDELVKANVCTPVKARRIKGYSAVRNHALHAEWNDFDIRDVGQLIEGTRELIDEFL